MSDLGTRHLWHGIGYELSVMSSIRLNFEVLSSFCLGAGTVVLLTVMAGCTADDVVNPGRTWEEVRYHRIDTQTGGSYGDLVVQASGEVAYELQGMGASSRGLLAGENLETLARLIAALPPAGYVGPPVQETSFFLSVVDEGETKNYSAGFDDPAAPPALRDLVGYLQTWLQHASSPRPDPLEFRILSQGEQSGVIREVSRLVRDRDDLVALVDCFRGHRPLFLPAVDFSKETVVAIFLGERPSSGHMVTVSGAGLTQFSQIIVSERRIVPGENCPVEATTATPYVLAALATSAAADLLVRTELLTQSCGTIASTDGP